MNEDLEAMFPNVAGEPPNDDFRAQLRRAVIAEANVRTSVASGRSSIEPKHSSANDPDHHDDAVFLESYAAETKSGYEAQSGLGVAAAASLLLLVGVAVALIMLSNGPAQVATANAPGTTIDSEPETSDQTESSRFAQTELLTIETGFFGPGTFAIDTLGTEFSFEVNTISGTLRNSDGIVFINDVSSRAGNDRTVMLRRISGLPNPGSLTAPPSSAPLWQATDLELWIANLDRGILATEPEVATVGGFDATVFELSIPCTIDTECDSASLPNDPNPPLFISGSRYLVWLVDQGEQDPLVITAAIPADTRSDWFPVARRIVDSIEIGTVAPNPVQELNAGPTTLAALGGLSLELDRSARINDVHPTLHRLIVDDLGLVEFVGRPLDASGTEVQSTERLLELLEDEAVQITSIGTVDVDGFEAQLFGLEGGLAIALNTRSADLARTDAGWVPPPSGHLWVIEHPERGLLLVASRPFDGNQDNTPLFNFTTALLSSVEFE